MSFNINDLFHLKEKVEAERTEFLTQAMIDRSKTVEEIEKLGLPKTIARLAEQGLNMEVSKKISAFERRKALELGRKCLRELEVPPGHF